MNNNSGGDAAYNAKQFMRILGLEHHTNAPKQVDEKFSQTSNFSRELENFG